MQFYFLCFTIYSALQQSGYLFCFYFVWHKAKRTIEKVNTCYLCRSDLPHFDVVVFYLDKKVLLIVGISLVPNDTNSRSHSTNTFQVLFPRPYQLYFLGYV